MLSCTRHPRPGDALMRLLTRLLPILWAVPFLVPVVSLALMIWIHLLVLGGIATQLI